MTRCAIYLRVSTADQAERSIPAQEQACRALAAERGWSVVQVFKDEGISAYHDAERPGFEAMREAAAAGAFDQLVAWDTDRLTRGAGPKSLLSLRWELRASGVGLSTVNQPDIENDDLAEIFDLIQGQRARSESKAKSDRARRGVQRRLEAGLPPGRAPLGYRITNGLLVVDDHTAWIARRIFEEHAAGAGQSEIARGLQRDGVPTTSGGRWWPATVRQILTNPTYVGLLPVGDGATVPGRHEALIDEDTFARVQSRVGGVHRRKELRGQTRAPRSGRSARVHLLSRLLVCGECGSRMEARLGELRRDGSRYATYTCPQHNGRFASSCGMRPIPRAPIDEAVLAHFQREVLDLEATREAFRRERDERVAQARERTEAAGQAAVRARARHERMRDLVADGRLPAEDLEPYRQQHEDAQRAADEALDAFNEASQASPPDDAEARLIERLTALREEVAGHLDASDGTVPRLRSQLALTFDRFEVFPGLVAEPLAVPLAEPHELSDPADLQEALASMGPDLRESDREDDPEAPVAAGSSATGWTIFPVLRPDAIEAIGLDFQPVTRRVPLTLHIP